MSEQPTQPLPTHLYKEGTVFDDPNGYQVNFGVNNSVPKYDRSAVELGRTMFEKTAKVEVEQPRLSEAAVRGVKLATLDQVRDKFKVIEETKFFQEDRAA